MCNGTLIVRPRSDSRHKTALDGAVGETLGYDQCPADEAGASWVTIAGMTYT